MRTGWLLALSLSVVAFGACTRSERPPPHPDVALVDGFVAPDAGHDASVIPDAGHDVGAHDGGMDAGHDASVIPDAGHDGGSDAGHDAAPSDAGPMHITWTTNATAFNCTTVGPVGSRATFTCPAGGSAGSLWGTGEYTNDSSICTAAVHSGHVSFASGGDVTIEMRAGRASYTGSMRNGVTSSSYGTWACSYAVVAPACLSASATDCSGLCADLTSDSSACGACGTTCTAPHTCIASSCACPGTTTACGTACVDTQTDAANCGTCGHACDATTQVCTAGSCVCAPGRTDCGGTCADLSSDPIHCGSCAMACAVGEVCTAMVCGARPITWTTNASDHVCTMAGVLGSHFAYACPASGVAGSAWGTDLYTNDSSICTAAAHVGLITTAAGGTVTIRMMPGAMSYAGSTRNGITTSSWGSWPCSYDFM